MALNLFQLFGIGIFSFALCFSLIVGALKFFPKWKMMDRPGRYGLSRSPIPYYGGLTLFATLMTTTLLFVLTKIVPVEFSRELVAVLVAVSFLTIVSFADDLVMVPAIFRFCAQAFAGGILVYGGIGIHSITNPFGAAFSLDRFGFSLGGHEFFLLGALFTIFWVVLLVNSMNFFDGVSGLVSGSTFLACAVFLLLSLRATNVIDQTMVAFLSVILGMSSLAFFLFDIPPAKILMGDTGSVLCGFLIAVLAIISGGKIATAFLVVGIPLLDAVFTLIRRVVKGQAPWKGDLQHLHHRLLSAGFSPRAVVWILLLCGAVFGGIALFLGSQQKAIALGLLAFFMMVLLVGLLLLKKDPS